MMKNNENLTIYSIKMVSAVFVIFIHCMFPGDVGIVIKNIARYAVPMFLVISGYYWKESRLDLPAYFQKAKRHTYKMLKLTAYAFVLYLTIYIASSFIQGEFGQLPGKFLNFRNWLYFLIFNYTTPFLGVGHLWYLFALLYIYLVILFIERNSSWKIVYYISAIFLLGVLITEIVSFYLGNTIPSFYFRNWLFTGLPLFVFGCFLKDYEDKIIKINISTLVILYLIILPFETILFKDSFEIMISSLLGCLILIKVALFNPNIDILSESGKYYSQWIYVYHYIFVLIVGHFLSTIHFPLLDWIQPLVVTFATILFSYITKRINNTILR